MKEALDINRRKSMINSSIFGKLLSKKEEKNTGETSGAIQLSAAMKGLGGLKPSLSNAG